MDEIKKYILKEIEILDNSKTKKYKIKYSNEYYVNMMMFLLKDVNNWYFLKNIKGYGNVNLTTDAVPKYHYKTIQNKFNYWTKKDIFKKAFENIKYDIQSNILIIDSTSINNKYGSENLIINPEYKKKQVTKLSTITNEHGFILSIQPFEVNKELKNNKFTGVHDVKMIENTLLNVKQNNNSKYYHLLADKAYKHNYNLKLNGKKVITITPDKKNSLIKNSNYKKNKLKKKNKSRTFKFRNKKI